MLLLGGILQWRTCIEYSISLADLSILCEKKQRQKFWRQGPTKKKKQMLFFFSGPFAKMGWEKFGGVPF